MRLELKTTPEVLVEYIAIVAPDTLAPVTVVNAGTIVAIAGQVGGTRLIDNIVLARGLG
jgi:pantothenate synthetase